MPGMVIHTWLALEILDRWKRRGDAPFDVTDPLVRQAFLNGSMGPDMGLFPGGNRLLTSLVHHIRSGQMARNLVHQASRPVELSYAWGWFSHLMGDVVIHPLINRAVQRHFGPERAPQLASGQDERAHRLVEMGLDAYWGHTRGHRCQWFQPMWDLEATEHLAAALRSTYQIEFSADVLLTSHRALARYSRTLCLLGRIHGARLARAPVPWDCLHHYWFRYLPVRTITALFRPNSTAFDLTHSLSPDHQLIEQVAGVMETYFDRFFAGVRSRLAELPDYDLHWGTLASEVEGYPPAEEARSEWAARLERMPSQYGSGNTGRARPLNGGA
ncbi:MAG TPA: hypothetical protein EYP56_01160 [Planctomycetaceae bacterium]|nr:hypothetical protein [Planctomycetaceae bacterium]